MLAKHYGAAAMVQSSPDATQAGSRSWHHPYDVFAGGQNARVMESWWLPPKFQRKTWETRKKFATGSELLQRAPVGQCLLETRAAVETPERQRYQQHGLPTQDSYRYNIPSMRAATWTSNAKGQGCPRPCEPVPTTVTQNAGGGPLRYNV